MHDAQNIDKAALQTSLNDSHKDNGRHISVRCQKVVQKHSMASNSVSLNSIAEIFVPSYPPAKLKNKFDFNWTEPRRISNALRPSVLVVKPLDGSTQEGIQSATIIHYEADWVSNVDLEDVLQPACWFRNHFEVLSDIQYLAEKSDIIYFLLEWDGLSGKRAYTRVKLSDVYKDVPRNERGGF